MDGHHDLLGWATPQLLDLDERVSYSIVSRLLRSGALVRQAIWLTLAHQRPEDDRDQLAQVVAKGWARDMIAYAFGRVPDGLLPALERIGGYPLDSRSYRIMWSIFNDPDHRKADVLRRLDGITDERLRVLDKMQGVLVHLRVLERTPTLAHLADLKHAVALIQGACTAATQDALVEAFDRMAAPASLQTLIRRCLRRADRLPPPPFEGDDEMRSLATARDLILAGRRMRNCLASKILDVAVGAAAFAAFGDEAICEFRRLSDGAWVLAEVHGRGNSFVPPVLRKRAQAKAESLGIPYVAQSGGYGYHAVRRIMAEARSIPVW